MPTFQPPSADTLPATVAGIPGNGAAYLLLRHFKSRARGQSVLRIGGVYGTYEHPTQDEIEAASEVYLGGHTYEVSDAVGSALTAAGYTVT